MSTARFSLSPALAAIVLAPILALTLAGCSPATDGSDQPGAGGGGNSDETAPPAPGDENKTDDAGDLELDHAGALAAGLNGETAIACVYNYDAEELAGIRQLSPTGWSTPVSDIYVDSGDVYWEIPQEDGRTSHVLFVDEVTYTWKTPDNDSIGARGESPGGADGLAERLERNASDCHVYTGSKSIFEVPSGIDFR